MQGRCGMQEGWGAAGQGLCQALRPQRELAELAGHWGWNSCWGNSSSPFSSMGIVQFPQASGFGEQALFELTRCGHFPLLIFHLSFSIIFCLFFFCLLFFIIFLFSVFSFLIFYLSFFIFGQTGPGCGTQCQGGDVSQVGFWSSFPAQMILG